MESKMSSPSTAGENEGGGANEKKSYTKPEIVDCLHEVTVFGSQEPIDV